MSLTLPMSNTTTRVDSPVVHLAPEKLADHSLHDVIFKQEYCNLPRNLAVTLGFYKSSGPGPTPGHTTTGVAQAIPKQRDTDPQSINTASPLITTDQQQDRTRPVSPRDALDDIVAVQTVTVNTTQSPPPRIPIRPGANSLCPDSASGTLSKAVSRMRDSPHDIHLQAVVVSLGTADVTDRDHATNGPSQTPTAPTDRATAVDRDRINTTHERIYGVGVTATVDNPTTQAARQADLSPDRTAARVLAPFQKRRAETEFITVARDPATGHLETPETRPFGTGLWSLLQASKIAPTELVQSHVSLSGQPGLLRVCEPDLRWFIGTPESDPTDAGLSHGER